MESGLGSKVVDVTWLEQCDCISSHLDGQLRRAGLDVPQKRGVVTRLQRAHGAYAPPLPPCQMMRDASCLSDGNWQEV